METIKKEDFLKNALIILRETFEGSPENQPSAFLDRGVGIFNTIDGLTATEVSKDIGDTSIAAQTEHAKFYLDRMCEFMTGRTEPVNWEQSWLIDEVNEEEWSYLRANVRKSYDSALRCFAEIETWNDDNTGEAIAIIAHTAYHLGAIRQIMKSAKQNGNN